jgi:uncharacterized protein YutD
MTLAGLARRHLYRLLLFYCSYGSAYFQATGINKSSDTKDCLSD